MTKTTAEKMGLPIPKEGSNAILLDWLRLNQDDLRAVTSQAGASVDLYEREVLAKNFQVVFVPSKNPEVVFEVLNTMQSEVEYRGRSMSVGDLLVEPDGRVLRCAWNGWSEVQPKGR